MGSKSRYFLFLSLYCLLTRKMVVLREDVTSAPVKRSGKESQNLLNHSLDPSSSARVGVFH